MSLTIRAFTLNCGNRTPGLETCKQLIDELVNSDVQMFLLHCQETHFKDTAALLRQATANHNLHISSSGPMVAHTTLATQFNNHTGLISFFVYKDQLQVELGSCQSIRRNEHRWQTGYSKGGILQRLWVRSGKETYQLISINGHLDAFNCQARQEDWLNLNQLLWRPCASWCDLVALAPDMLVTGLDANTRNQITLIKDGYVSNNAWEHVSRREVKSMLEHPLGFRRESTISTKEPDKDYQELDTPDAHRPNYAKGGMLDLVCYMDPNDFLSDNSSQIRVHSAKTVIWPEEHAARDHSVIGSSPITIKPKSTHTRVSEFIASGIMGTKPLLARLILQKRIQSELQLLSIYQQQVAVVNLRDGQSQVSHANHGFFIKNPLYRRVVESDQLHSATNCT